MMILSKELLYTENHEWVKIEKEVATIGITEFAQNNLGDIVYVDVQTIEQTIAEGNVFGTIEAVKTVADLFMPLSGKILEFNETLENQPEWINKDPYGKGWIIKIKIDDKGKQLMTSEKYQKLIENNE